jgi:FAD/FMN-containing dehydrogenase
VSQVLDSGLQAFRDAFGGRVITAEDPEYNTARSVWNGDIDRYPAVVARCADASDATAAIGFARTSGLEISVRGGGHNFSGAAVADGALMIDLSLLRHVVVDPVARRVRCGGGTTGADLDAATQEHGLAVTMGTISHTGIAGLSLGGGFGWLTNLMGLSCDNLISAEVALADGRVVRAAEDSHPDLYWALRGGGGNFGVVTEFEFQLQPVGPLVHFALFFWELDRRADALRVARDALQGLPRDAGGLLAAGLAAPPEPFVPEQYHFAPGCAVIVAGFGSAEDHAALLTPIRAGLTPAFEFVTQLPYTALQQTLDASAPWGIHAYEKGLEIDEMPNGLIDTLVEYLPKKQSPLSFLPIFPLGGAYTDVAEDATAFGGSRTARWFVNVGATSPDPAVLAHDRVWVRELWQALSPYASNTGGYVNFMAEYESDRVRTSYGPTKYERLSKIKTSYDPDNVFHLNPNILPG